MIREEMMSGENGIPKADIISFIIRDLLHKTDTLGIHHQLYMDEPKIFNGRLYCRELRFVISQPNVVTGQ